MSEYHRHTPDRPDNWTPADEIRKRPDLGELWAKWRKMRQENEDYLAGLGGGQLTMQPGRQSTLIDIETMGVE